MYKLNEQIPISVWEKIADVVQMLEISEVTEEEFKTNLKRLKELLERTDICLEEFSRVPLKSEQIGLASLLDGIYTSDADITRKKSRFYETIYTLSDLGIKSIEFKPISFCKGICGFTKKEVIDDQYHLAKFFTDGDFKIIELPIKGEEYYWIDDLQRANYVFNMSLSEKNGIISVEEAQAALRNFNGTYPTKKEFMKMEHTKMIVPSQSISFGNDVSNIYQSFEKVDVRDTTYIKRLTKDSKGNYYYS